MRKICVITGTRAEYGLLSGLMRLIQQSQETELQIVATNMHLSTRYGETYREIENDGFIIDCKVPILDDSCNQLESMSKALIGIGDALDKLNPDLVVLLGDRYEIMAAATACMMKRIPIAHLHGGEITEGAYDDAIRHSVTKMSHLHFCSTEEYRKRIIQLGEDPKRVFYVGALGVENIHQLPLMTQQELKDSLGFEVNENTWMVTYHPVTLLDSAKHDIDALLSALDVYKDKTIIFTMPNSDNGGDVIANAIAEWVDLNRRRAHAYISLGVKRYLSVLNYCGACVGNSSSGILEAPSFHVPTLNIGPRQQGRITSDSVWHCGTSEEEICEGLRHIMSDEFKKIAQHAVNPYDKQGTAQAIFDVISTYSLEGIINKHFYDL